MVGRLVDEEREHAGLRVGLEEQPVIERLDDHRALRHGVLQAIARHECADGIRHRDFARHGRIVGASKAVDGDRAERDVVIRGAGSVGGARVRRNGELLRVDGTDRDDEERCREGREKRMHGAHGDTWYG